MLIVKVKKLATENKLNFNYVSNSEISISINEATELDDIKLIFEIFSKHTIKILNLINFE